MSHSLSTSVAMGVLILLIAFSIPYAIDISQTDNTTTLNLTEGQSQTLLDGQINITIERVRPATPANATVTVTDTATITSETATIATADNYTFDMQGGNVTATVQEVYTGGSIVRFDYSPTYGWDDSQKDLVNFLPVLLAVLALVIVGGLIRSAINRH